MIDLTQVPWEQLGVAGFIVAAVAYVALKVLIFAIGKAFGLFERMLDLWQGLQSAFTSFETTLKDSIKSDIAMTNEVRMRTKIIAQEFTEVKLGVADISANTASVRDDLKLVETSHNLQHGELLSILKKMEESGGKNLTATDAVLQLLRDQRSEMNMNHEMQVSRIDDLIAAVTNMGKNAANADPELILPALPEGGESGNGRTGESPEPENIPTTPVI